MAEDADIPVTSSNNNAAGQNSDSAMARLLLARSMAQRAQAMAESSSGNGSSVMATSENSARTPERKVGSVSPHPSSMKSEDDRTPSPTNMTPTPPVQMSEVTRDRSPINPHDREDVRDFIRDQRHFDPLRIDAVDHGNDATYALPDSSPENQGLDSASDNPSKFYKCRLCNFYATTYTQLQLHMPKHGGMKALKCPLCDYATNDKSNFRRHRRLHMGTNPVSVLKCGKCSYSTILPRKFREHYSQVHNEQLDTNVPYSHQPHTHFRPQGFTDTQFGIGPMDMSQHKPHHSPSNGNLAATNALHSLLTGIHHQNPPMGYRTQTYPTQGQCINQYGNYITPVRQTNEENHLASNYLRSIVSSIMNTHPPNRIPPSSTITSSNFYLSPMAQEQQHMTATQSSILSSSRSHDLDLSIHNLSSEVKVKVEPPERDGTPDVSSSAIPHHHHSIHDMSQQISMSTYPRGYSELSENNVTVDANEASTSVDVMRTNSTDSTQFPRRENRSSTDNGINTTIKTELTSVGVQCSLSQLKSESLYLSIERSLLPKVDQGIQCELVSGNNRCNQRSHSVASESECSEPQSNRCPHCGIIFDDEVLYSIHIGCHSHTDPFVCNVCGKQCGNKYGFYSHIMRGHHY